MAHSTDMAHALLGASSSHRWLHCTPSARMEEPIENTGSVYADEGSLAHAIGARGLKLRLGMDTSAEDLEIAHYRGHLTDEMPAHVGKYVGMGIALYERALVQSRALRRERYIRPEIHIEQHLDYSEWVPQGFGTGDTVVVEKGRLTVLDLKYGKGVRVMAQDNPQLKLYALGALDIYDYAYGIEEVELCICQPRLEHYDRWSLSRRALMEWAEGELREKALRAWEGKGERVAGRWCRFCRAKGICPTRGMRDFEGMF